MKLCDTVLESGKINKYFKEELILHFANPSQENFWKRPGFSNSIEFLVWIEFQLVVPSGLIDFSNWLRFFEPVGIF